MTKKLVAVAALALAAVVVGSTFDTAEARRGGGGWHGGGARFVGRSFGGGSFRAFRAGPSIGRVYAGGYRHRHFRRGIGFVGVPLAAYGGYYAYGGGYGCGWLYRRAVYTGSGYWWNQYYACVNGYGY
jgi:hypothetical protein